MDKAIQAILDAVPGARLKDKIGTLEARKAELSELLENAQEPPPLLHPNMAGIYHQKTAALYRELQSEEAKAPATEIFRSLVNQVNLVPEGGNARDRPARRPGRDPSVCGGQEKPRRPFGSRGFG